MPLAIITMAGLFLATVALAFYAAYLMKGGK